MDNSTIDEVKASLKQAGYTYNENMSVDNNIGSAMLGEYAEGYKKGYDDKCIHVIADISLRMCLLCQDDCRNCPIVNYCIEHQGITCVKVWEQFFKERAKD